MHSDLSVARPPRQGVAKRTDQLAVLATADPSPYRSSMAKRDREEDSDILLVAHDLEAAAGREDDAPRKQKVRLRSQPLPPLPKQLKES